MTVSMRDVSRRVKRLFRWRDPDRFLRSVSGVVHVGANVGQERAVYAQHALNVIWIEPIPEVFAELERNINGFPKQRAFNCLIADQDGTKYDFHVASNHGASSSILDLHLHRDIWPQVSYDRSIALESVTLSTFFEKFDVDSTIYDALVMDTQGSEMMVLQGALGLLSGFRYMKTEVPDFEAYAGCCILGELDAFMTAHGFQEFSRNEFAVRAKGGSYYNVVYERNSFVN